MTIATQKMTLEEYLNYDDGTDIGYELDNGELVATAPESEPNRRIASFLFLFFAQQGIPSYRLTMKTEIVISGTRATTRFPDVMVMSDELATALEGARRSTIMFDMPPPPLVVEVVSSNQENRDYRYKRLTGVTLKRTEYAARGIGEYWIVDPQQQRVTVLKQVEGLYEETVFEGNSPIASPLFGSLSLTPSEILQGQA